MELAIENVSKYYGKVAALKGVDISLNNGVYGLIGPNGAGKTTMINIILGIIHASNGDVRFNQKRIQEYGDKFYKKVGYLPQYPTFYKNFKGAEFLRYMCEMKGITPNGINDILKMVNLEDDKNKKIGAYSGGMKQRLGIAQAILNNPEILILDEPTAGLDPAERIRFRNIISTLSANRIVILATHIISDIEAVAKEVILLNKGEVIIKETPEKLIEELKGKVWEFMTDSNGMDAYHDGIISNVQVINKNYHVKVISETKPVTTSVPGRASLDDVFLYYFGSKK